MYIQHGDCLLKQCEKPTDIKILKTDIIYQGLNHSHKIRGKFRIAKRGDDVFLHSKGAEIYHAEHLPLKVPEGFWKLEVVKEYDHLLEESRKVID
jgi:hypothetical protein